jgi:hypothetical protein
MLWAAWRYPAPIVISRTGAGLGANCSLLAVVTLRPGVLVKPNGPGGM